jgi:7,8-dihydro-6-hydroxymethylpterin-pyrophosphokinase
MVWVCVGIGSNIEPKRNIPHALAELRRRFGALTVSRFTPTRRLALPATIS